jgi:putative transposase
VLIKRPSAREETDAIPLLWQADLLSVSRSRLYYEPRSARQQEIRIKHRLDEWYTERPCLGSRKLVTLLAQDGLNVSRHTIRRYRAEMGLATLYPKPNLSQPSPVGHRVYSYLLRGLSIVRPNQVWGVDITYIRLRGGFLYLVAFLDWFSRRVMAWELSDTLEMPFVLSCAEAAFGQAVPEIINSDQGSHFIYNLLRVSATRAASLQRGRRFRWTDAGAMWTTSSQSACGAVLSTRRCT